MNDEQLQEQVPETPETEAQVEETPTETPENTAQNDAGEPESVDSDVSDEDLTDWAILQLQKKGYKVEREEARPKEPEPAPVEDDSYVDEYTGEIDVKKMESVLQRKLLNQIAPALAAPLAQSVISEARAILGNIPSAMQELEETMSSLPPDKIVAISQMDKSARELAFLKLYHQHSIANEKPKGTSSSFGTATPAPTGTTQMSQYVRENLDRWQERFPHLTRNEIIQRLKNIEESN